MRATVGQEGPSTCSNGKEVRRLGVQVHWASRKTAQPRPSGVKGENRHVVNGKCL